MRLFTSVLLKVSAGQSILNLTKPDVKEADSRGMTRPDAVRSPGGFIVHDAHRMNLLLPLPAVGDNAAMDELPSVEELIARLEKLDDERARLIEESAEVREQLLHILARKEKPADPPPKPA
jgi:hypothetical protein